LRRLSPCSILAAAIAAALNFFTESLSTWRSSVLDDAEMMWTYSQLWRVVDSSSAEVDIVVVDSSSAGVNIVVVDNSSVGVDVVYEKIVSNRSSYPLQP
jgi:hypothetical protein